MEAQDRVLAITEATARHEMEMDKRRHEDSVALTKTELDNNSDEVKRGQDRAFAVVIAIIIGGFLMIYLGHDVGGIASLLVATAGVAGIFVRQFAIGRIRSSRPKSADKSVHSDSTPESEPTA